VAFATPLTAPAKVRTIKGYGIVHPRGLTIDAGGELYVDNVSGQSSFVAAYPVTANGKPAPDWKVRVRNTVDFGNGIDTTHEMLFVPDTGAGLVYELHATQGGAQPPVAALPVTSPKDVKTAP